MAHVEKRAPGRWRARYRGPDGRERSKTFGRRTDAERFLEEHAVDLEGRVAAHRDQDRSHRNEQQARRQQGPPADRVREASERDREQGDGDRVRREREAKATQLQPPKPTKLEKALLDLRKHPEFAEASVRHFTGCLRERKDELERNQAALDGLTDPQEAEKVPEAVRLAYEEMEMLLDLFGWMSIGKTGEALEAGMSLKSYRLRAFAALETGVPVGARRRHSGRRHDLMKPRDRRSHGASSGRYPSQTDPCSWRGWWAGSRCGCPSQRGAVAHRRVGPGPSHPSGRRRPRP